jgi:hypothetical protein
VVGGGRDYGRDGSHDAPLAETAERARLQRFMGLPQTQSQPQAGSDEDGGGGPTALPGEILRFQRAAFS